jgi:hypothetical protein
MIKQPTRLIEIPLSQILVQRRFRRHMGDIDALVESIRELGLLQPIVITPAGRLIAGERRMEACCRLGLKSIMCCVAETGDDVWAQMLAEVQENTCRQRFRPSEAVRAARELEPIAKSAARRRMVHEDEGASENLPEGGEAMEQIAKLVDMSRPTLEKAIKVVEAAREEPDKYQDLVEQMDQTGKVNGAYIELINRQGKTVQTNANPGFSVRMDRHGAFKIIGLQNKEEIIAKLKALILQIETDISKAL